MGHPQNRIEAEAEFPAGLRRPRKPVQVSLESLTGRWAGVLRESRPSAKRDFADATSFTQALCCHGPDAPLQPFAVGFAQQQALLAILNLGTDILTVQAGERLKTIQVGHWMVMPSPRQHNAEPPFAPAPEACARELAVLEHAVQERWLQAPEFVLAIRQGGGQTPGRAYVLKPGLHLSEFLEHSPPPST